MKQDLIACFRAAVVSLLAFTVLTGLVYPLAMIGFARATGAQPATELVGQPFTDNAYFWSRPSASSPFAYNGGASTGTNLGMSDGKGGKNATLRATASDRITALRDADPGNSAPIPADLVTSSASGLDPHISPEAAAYQVPRVAKARGMSVAEVKALVDDHTEARTLGILGEPRVNVVLLNRALDVRRGPPRAALRSR